MNKFIGLARKSNGFAVLDCVCTPRRACQPQGAQSTDEAAVGSRSAGVTMVGNQSRQCKLYPMGASECEAPRLTESGDAPLLCPQILLYPYRLFASCDTSALRGSLSHPAVALHVSLLIWSRLWSSTVPVSSCDLPPASAPCLQCNNRLPCGRASPGPSQSAMNCLAILVDATRWRHCMRCPIANAPGLLRLSQDKTAVYTFAVSRHNCVPAEDQWRFQPSGCCASHAPHIRPALLHSTKHSLAGDTPAFGRRTTCMIYGGLLL